MKEQDGINLIDKVISDSNLWLAYEKVLQNKGAPGVDGITVYQLKPHEGVLHSSKEEVEKRNIPTTTGEKSSHSQKGWIQTISWHSMCLR